MMNRPVFIHPNPQVLTRISKESGGFARVTPSMVEALRWISDHEENISGIFLCPDDGSFSAFRFLEITLNYRPAVPIYIFEPTLQKHGEIAKRVKNNTHIKGFFVGTESYDTLVANLKSHVNPATDLKREKVSSELEFQDYTAIPISDFYNADVYPYNVFIFKESGQLGFFANKLSPIDGNYLESLSKKTKFFYVKSEEILEEKNKLKEAHSNLIQSKDFPIEWKTAEVLAESKTLLNEIKGNGINEKTVGVTQAMLGDLFRLIGTIDIDNGSISRLIDKAKSSDRSVFCASFAILMCKHLKFEKIATLEILGMASILQDISLYKTASGDLADRSIESLNENELKIYFKHPTTSADIIAQNTDIPQVTLQVIRQQHERRDKSGYPNRVSGNQLHPMAEILSLINCYYEVSKKVSGSHEIMLEMEKTELPHYSEAVVTAFKIVHTKL